MSSSISPNDTANIVTFLEKSKKLLNKMFGNIKNTCFLAFRASKKNVPRWLRLDECQHFQEMSTAPGILSTYPVKRLSTTSEKDNPNARHCGGAAARH
jgi:hypothetical protein